MVKFLKKPLSKMPLGVAIVLVLIALYMLCTCMQPIESFNNSAPINYNMQSGVPNDFQQFEKSTWGPSEWYKALEGNVGGPVPLPEGELSFFSKNKFDPSCCPSTYSSSLGCACESVEQAQYLNQRGGNRTLSSEY